MRIYLECFFLIQFLELVLFLMAHKTKRNDLADVGWGLGFGIVAVFVFFKNPEPVYFQKILLLIILAWSCRLAFFLVWRMKGKSEDQRYFEMRKSWGKKAALKSYLFVFVLQGTLLSLLAIPVIYHLQNVNPHLNECTWFSLGLSLFGLFYETIADFQKTLFKKSYPSKDFFIKTGLFKYSRYPQYFGEILFWSGVALFQFRLGWNLALILFPSLLAILILKFSGVALLEKNYFKRTGYKEYADQTPLIVPFFKTDGDSK